MLPKQIIIKTSSKKLINSINNELSLLHSIRYNCHKFNGFYTINIKCSSYYKKLIKHTPKSFYGNYIFLYTNVSLLLSEIIIANFERLFIKREFKNNYFYLNDSDQNNICNITSSILDPNYPNEINKNYYMFRKELILNDLLKMFRHQNYIYLDSFINFSLYDYKNELLKLIDKSVNFFFSNNDYLELIKMIIKNFPFYD